jgi:hypothetical protein
MTKSREGADGGTSHQIKAGFHRPSFSLSKEINGAPATLAESRTERQNALNQINQQINRPKSVQRERPVPKSRLHDEAEVAKLNENRAEDDFQDQGGKAENILILPADSI